MGIRISVDTDSLAEEIEKGGRNGGCGGGGPKSTAETRIDFAFRPREIEKALKHLGKDLKARSPVEVVLKFKGELRVDFDPQNDGTDIVANVWKCRLTNRAS